MQNIIWLLDTSLRLTNKNKKNTQTQTVKFRGAPASSLQYETEKERPRVFRQPAFIYPVIIEEWAPDDRYPKGYAEVTWDPVEMLELKRFKETGVS